MNESLATLQGIHSNLIGANVLLATIVVILIFILARSK